LSKSAEGATPWSLLATLAIRPGLWGVAFRQMLKLAGPGWWRKWPPVPLPDPAYYRFRLETAYGDSGRRPAVSDIVDWLEWCRRENQLR